MPKPAVSDREALLRKLRQVRGLYARAPEAVIVYDPKGKLDCNQTALRIFGYRRKADLLAEPRGRTSPRRQPDGRSSAAAARAYHAEAFRRGHVKFDWVHRRPDGTEFPAEVVLTTFRLDGHALVRSDVRDVTAERRAAAERAAGEAALRASEERFRAMAEASPVGLAVHSLHQARLLYVNDAFAALYRIDREALLQRPLADGWVNPDDRRRLRDLMRHGGTVEEFIAQHRRADGSVFWAAASARAIQFEGQPCWISAVRDLTAQKQAEVALQASEARFRHLAEAHPVPMVVHCAREDRFLYVSDACARLFRLPRARMLAMAPSELWIDPEDRRRGRRMLEESAALDNFQARMRRGDGTEFWADMSGRVIDFDGVPAVTAAIRDLTDQVAAEAALRDSEERFRQVAELHPVPLTIADHPYRKYLYVSPAAAKLFGTSVEHMLATSPDDFWADPADMRQAGEYLFSQGGMDDYEARLRRADGQDVWISATVRKVEYQGGHAWLNALVDITARKTMADELARQRETLEQSAKLAAMGSLLAGVSHELNNPLAVVMAQAELLRDLSGDSPFAERAGKIHAAAERCARIVRTFLALARQKPPSARTFDLNQVARSAVELLGYGLKSAGVVVRLDLAADLPPLFGDADQMAQVLSNLMVNAQQAMQQQSTPRRLVIATRRAASGKRVRLRVTDSGPGVPLQIRSRIFEPFFTTKPVGTGTGIGLALCHNIVAAHGGTITVQDAPGGGTRFLIVLPVRAVAEIQAPAATEAPAAAALARAILVIDDEPQLLSSLADILTPMANRVDRALNGREAMALIARHSYDAILSDLRMPDMDGPALYAELARRRPELLRRLIFVTGDTLGAGVAEFLLSAGAPVIEKPFSAADVRLAVVQALKPD